MRRATSFRIPASGRLGRAAALLAAGLLVGGCAPSPIAFGGLTDVRSVEVALAEIPPFEVTYHQQQPPGVLGYLGTGPYMLSTIYRSWADSKKTEQLLPKLRGLDPAEAILSPFVETLRKSGVFRRIVRRGAAETFGPSGPPLDAFIEIEVERWGFTYATEERLSAQVVIVARMRPTRGGEELLWRRRLVETDGARTPLEELTADGQTVHTILGRTLQAAGVDLARDLLGPSRTQRLMKPVL